MPTVFVIAQDWNLRAHVRAELREQGIEALGMETVDEAAQALARGTLPAAVVLEAGVSAPDSGLALLAKRVPVVLVASRTHAAPPLEEAVAVLWRPVSIAEVVARVKQVLRGHAA